jgi:uncharacterized membrane protein
MKNLLLFLLCFAALASCKNDSYDELYPAPSGSADKCDTTKNKSTFSTNVKAIVDAKCATSGCHNSSSRAAGYDFSSYAGLQSVATSGRLVQVTAVSKRMPPSAPLTDCELAQVVNWVNNGAQNN